MDLYNLYNPIIFPSMFSILLTAFLLGVIHGFTPDEHTWPITFSYSIGSYSWKGGFKTGLLFSAAFTFQRAVASELAYFALSGILSKPLVEPVVYLCVGAVMAFAGGYIMGIGKNFEFLDNIKKSVLKILRLRPNKNNACKNGEYGGVQAQNQASMPKSRSIPFKIVLLHGFIAGWGTGAFAIIIYTVLAPKMPNAYTGFLPGLLFGLGTMATQIIIGVLIGRFMERLKMTKKGVEYVAKKTSGMALLWGGIAFVMAAGLEIAFPRLMNSGIVTPIKIRNLHNLGIGFFLVVFVVMLIIVISFIKSVSYVKNNREAFASESIKEERK